FKGHLVRSGRKRKETVKSVRVCFGGADGLLFDHRGSYFGIRNWAATGISDKPGNVPCRNLCNSRYSYAWNERTKTCKQNSRRNNASKHGLPPVGANHLCHQIRRQPPEIYSLRLQPLPTNVKPVDHSLSIT